MMEDASEIQEALGRSYGTPDIDEADLEAGRLKNKKKNTCICLNFVTLNVKKTVLQTL